MVKKTLGILSVSAVAIALVFIFNQDEAIEAQSVEEIDQKLDEIQSEKKSVNNELNDLKSKLQEVENKKASTKAELQNINNRISKTESEIKLKELEIEETKTEINRLEAQIKELEQEIEELENLITELEDEIETTKNRISEREDLLKDRIRSLQRSGGSVKYLEVIMGAEDFGDLITRTRAVNKIMNQDQKILDNHLKDKQKLEEDHNKLEESKKSVVTKKTEVENSKVEVENRHNRLVTQKQELNSLVASLNQKKDEQQVVLASLEKEEANLHEFKLSLAEERRLIRKQEQNLKKAKRVAQANNDSGFITPMQGVITSRFSNSRIDPVTGSYSRPHTGLDLGNGRTGRRTPIVAAASGVVLEANTGCVEGVYYCGGQLGNYVIIQHYINGKEYATIYGHMSQVNVRSGQEVNAGQKIGQMGSTGHSTGPHLHFEIHPGGIQSPRNPVNPLRFINP